ncbi:MAG: hydroxyisourate hydrolase [Candidatus Acidiferrales bacterium]
MSDITTHVLDTSVGRPAVGVPVLLEIQSSPGVWREISRGATDSDGRLRHLLSSGSLTEAAYRLTFDTRAYFQSRGVTALYPSVTIVFDVRYPKEQHHIPLLLGPFGYTTYRGS